MASYEKDLATVNSILSKGVENLTSEDRLRLLQIVQIVFHDSGKIEGIWSMDSTTESDFFQKMRNSKNPNCICLKCYAARLAAFRTNMKKRHALTALILSTVQFTIDELRTRPVFGILRHNSDGEFVNEIHATNAVNQAYAFPDLKVGTFSKNVEVLEAVFDKIGKPANLKFIQSSPIIDHKCRRSRYADYTFTVYSTPEKVAEAIANGSMPCNGRKCNACGFSCYLGLWPQGSDIAELLRG